MSVKELSFKEGAIFGLCLGALSVVLLTALADMFSEISKARIEYCNDKTNVNPFNLRGTQNER